MAFLFCLHPILVFYQTICNGFFRLFGIFAFDIVCVSDFIIQFNRQIFNNICKILSITECVFRRKSNQMAENAQCTRFQWKFLFDIGFGSEFNILTIQSDSSASSLLKHCTYCIYKRSYVRSATLSLLTCYIHSIFDNIIL